MQGSHGKWGGGKGPGFNKLKAIGKLKRESNPQGSVSEKMEAVSEKRDEKEWPIWPRVIYCVLYKKGETIVNLEARGRKAGPESQKIIDVGIARKSSTPCPPTMVTGWPYDCIWHRCPQRLALHACRTLSLNYPLSQAVSSDQTMLVLIHTCTHVALPPLGLFLLCLFHGSSSSATLKCQVPGSIPSLCISLLGLP